jgi:DNA polymerase zeta
MMTKIANLLRSGAIMGTKYQVHEAHVPFVLQFFIDYNLYGMGYMNLSSFKFRHPVPKKLHILQWNNQIQYETLDPLQAFKDRLTAASHTSSKIWTENTISKGDIIHTLPRTTTCQLEIDTEADCILQSLH